MMTFYSPLYKSNVKIVRTRCDCDGEPIYHVLINGKEIFFRASELEGKAVLNKKKKKIDICRKLPTLEP